MGKYLSRTDVRCICALICCALWGSAFPCVKIGYNWLDIETTESQILFAGYRFFLAGMMTFVVACVLKKGLIKVSKKAVNHVMAVGFFQTTVQYVCFYIGMSNITGTKGSIINASSAFVSIIIAHFFVKDEPLNMKKAIGCMLGLIGVVLVNLNGFDTSFSFAGEGMIIICTVVYGACAVYTKLISHLAEPMALTAYQLLFGGALLVIIGIVTGGSITEFDMKSVILLIYMAFISAAAFSIWTALLKYNQVSEISVFCFSIPVFGVLLSAVLLGEDFTSLINLLALACVSVGIVIVNIQRKQIK